MIYEEVTSILISKECISNSNKFSNNLKVNNIRTKQENVIIFITITKIIRKRVKS